MTVDIEKLTKGLECCLSPVTMCGECPYTVRNCLDMKRDMYTLVKQQTAEAELEGGGHTWFFVCGECHGSIDTHDKFCRHCGRGIIWK